PCERAEEQRLAGASLAENQYALAGLDRDSPALKPNAPGWRGDLQVIDDQSFPRCAAFFRLAFPNLDSAFRRVLDLGLDHGPAEHGHPQQRGAPVRYGAEVVHEPA